jgi:transcriptional regulator with XRE-family HTH domain
MEFRPRLSDELARRRQRNPHYSLRAFARDLGTDHATLSQILRERRPLSSRMITALGRRLGIERAGLTACRVQQDAAAVVRLISSGNFQPNTRWIAIRTGLPIDSVNAALQSLLSRRVLVMKSPSSWKFKKSHA